MHHRPARIIVTILGLTLISTMFGAAAEGKRATDSGLVPSTTSPVAMDARTEWCLNLSNAPAMLDAAVAAAAFGPEDAELRTTIESAAERPMSRTGARRIGSEYAALAKQWDSWDRVCTAAYGRRA